MINKQSTLYHKAVHEDIGPDINHSSDSTELWFSEKELKERLKAAIDDLPEKCRIVFKKSREEHLSNEAIAREMNISEKTVEAHITRALQRLKNALQVSGPLIIFLLKK